MSLASRIAQGRPTPPQMPQDTRCPEVWRDTRCELPAGHVEAFHRAGERRWGFRDEPSRPDWVVRALEHRLPARVEGGAER
jgi:hypothetical protein